MLVDVETIRTNVDDKYVGQTVAQQLGSAEVLVANKTDLVTAEELTSTIDWLADRCPDAFVLVTTNSEVPPEFLFGRPSSADPGAHGAPGDRHHHPEQIFTTEVWSPTGPQTRDAVQMRMAELPTSVVRAKGLVWLEDESQPFVLQRVGRRHTLRRSRNPWPDKPATAVVVITAGQ